MAENCQPLSDRSGLEPPFGEPKTPEDWIATADWWLRELGDALPEASPMFRALVRLRAENAALRTLIVAMTDYTEAAVAGWSSVDARRERLHQAHQAVNELSGAIDEIQAPGGNDA